MERHFGNQYLSENIFSSPGKKNNRLDGPAGDSSRTTPGSSGTALSSVPFPEKAVSPKGLSRPFAPAGQSTQMIIGATPENDYQLLKVTQALYQQYDLKRVFFSAYIPLNEDRDLPSLDTTPPLLREHRLYQATGF